MEVADAIVVINDGVVEQVGTPAELYDRPANEFVMTFLGPVTKLGGQVVRPHDLEVFDTPVPGSVAVTVTRLVRLGFEVRVDAVAASDGGGDGQEVWVQLTRGEAGRLGVEPGSVLYVRIPTRRATPVGSP